MNKTDKADKYGSLEKQLATGNYNPATAELDIELGNDLGFSGRNVKAVTDPRTVAGDTRSVLEQAQRALASVQGKARTMQIVLAYCRVCNALKG